MASLPGLFVYKQSHRVCSMHTPLNQAISKRLQVELL